MSSIFRKAKRMALTNGVKHRRHSLRAQGIKEITVHEKGKTKVKQIPVQEPFRKDAVRKKV